MSTDFTHADHANDLYERLVEDYEDRELTGSEFESPYDSDSELFKDVPRLTSEDLTDTLVGGKGTFDTIMTSIRNHLKEEYEEDRISGSEYVNAYVSLTEAALGNSVQFLLQKDASHWAAINAQLNAIKANIDLQKARKEYLGILAQLDNAKAQTALIKMQIDGTDKANTKADFEIDNLLSKQDELLRAQIAKEWSNTKNDLVLENVTGGFEESGSPVEGVIGDQRALYQQQLKSYRQDTINSTMSNLYNSWAAGVTNGVPNIKTPKVVSSTEFGKAMKAQFDSLRDNSEWDSGNALDNESSWGVE